MSHKIFKKSKKYEESKSPKPFKNILGENKEKSKLVNDLLS